MLKGNIALVRLSASDFEAAAENTAIDFPTVSLYILRQLTTFRALGDKNEAKDLSRAPGHENLLQRLAPGGGAADDQ